MKRRLLIGLICLMSFSSLLANRVDWLILMDMAANNDLYPFVSYNVDALEQYGSNNNATVVLQITKPGGACSRYLLCKGHLRLLSSLGHVDSASQNLFTSFLIYGIKNFPACKRMLLMWDHATGYVNATDFAVRATRSIFYDQTHKSWLNSINMLNSFKAAYQCTNCTFDIIAFDACYTQMLEMQTMLAPYATYIVAPEEQMPNPGLNYNLMLKPFQSGTLSASAFAKQLVYDFYAQYKDNTEYPDYTLSDVDSAKMLLLENNCNTVAKLLICCLKTQINSTVADTITACLNSPDCLHFVIPAYIDMARWYQVLLANLADFKVTNCSLKILLDGALRQGLTLLSAAVIANTAGGVDARALGISICFPPTTMYPSYAHSPFACVNAWVPFLEYYYTTLKK